jgi:hypothetical protein
MKIKHKHIERPDSDYKMSREIREKHRGYMQAYRNRIKNGIIPTPAHLRNKTKNPHYHNEYYKVIRDDVINYYSEGKNKCNCCDENTKQFLALDHINGGGKKHRKEIKVNLYWWCKKNNYPTGFQVLCHNCNMAKGFYGKCPHLLKILTK